MIEWRRWGGAAGDRSGPGLGLVWSGVWGLGQDRLGLVWAWSGPGLGTGLGLVWAWFGYKSGPGLGLVLAWSGPGRGVYTPGWGNC